MGSKPRTWYQRALAAIYPERCCCCGELVTCGELVCADCAQRLTPIPPPVCLVCGYAAGDCVCRRPNDHHDYTVRCIAPFYYEGAARDAIHRLKFRGHRAAGELLADGMAAVVAREYGGVALDCLVPVPVHARTRRERGYDQCTVLARGLATALGLPVREVLVKRWETAPQRGLPAYRRSGNVLGVFDRAGGTTVEDQTILLVDDVSTTGATLDECAKVLLIGGARAVYAVAAALTPSDDDAAGDR